MIVKCEECQTRFKIPDEKVTEKGIKVRCTKCGHTFRVSRPGASGGSEGPVAPARAPAAPALPVEEDLDPFAAFSTPPPATQQVKDSSRPGIRPPGIAAPREGLGAALPPLTSSDQDEISALFEAPPRPVSPARPLPVASPAPVRLPTPARPLPAAPPPPPPPPSPAPSSSLGDDLFGDLGSLSADDAADGPSAEQDLALAFGEPAAVSASAAGAPAGSSAEQDLALAFDQPGALDAPAGDEAEQPSLVMDSAGFFGAPEADVQSTSSVPSPPSPGVDRAMFDMSHAHPPPPEPAGGPVAPAPPPPAPVVAPAPVQPPAPQAPAVSRPVQKPAGRPEDARGLDERAHVGGARRAGGLIINIAVAAALVLVLVAVGGAYLNEGKLDASAFSLERVKRLFLPAGGMVAVDVSNGLYETRQGRPVFFVRGEVENRGARRGKAKVRVEILDDAQLVRAVESYAGATPSPEEMYGLSTAEDVEKLSARMTQAAVEIEPGQRAPFLAAFYEYPPDLSSLRLKVTPREVTPGETAAR